MRVLAILLVAMMLAGCTSDESTVVQYPEGQTANPSVDGNRTAEPGPAGEDGDAGMPGQDGVGAQQCADEAMVEDLWALPEDYDPAGDSGSEEFSWSDSLVRFRATWSEVRSGNFALAIFANGTEIWSTSGEGAQIRASPGAGPQSGEQRVFHDLRLEWSADGVMDGLAVEVAHRACQAS